MRTAPAIAFGYSKDPRPDLKKLLFILTTDADDGVPVQFRCTDGNTTGVRTHIDTWNTLRALTGRADFLYVADSKLCSYDNMQHIARAGGELVRVFPPALTELQMIVHTGTHVDSPRHFSNDEPAFQDIPLARLMGAGVVWRLDVPLYGLIEPADLERMRPRLAPGDILALDTGATQRVGTPAYDRHASLSVAAAEWLVQQKVKLIAVDMPTPDIAIDRRPEGFIWPVHRALLRFGGLIAGQVTNLGSLAGRRAEFMFCPLNIADCDGATARVLARSIAD